MRWSSMAETTFTFRVDQHLKADFSDAAKRIDRRAAQVLRDFMRQFVRETSGAPSSLEKTPRRRRRSK